MKTLCIFAPEADDSSYKNSSALLAAARIIQEQLPDVGLELIFLRQPSEGVCDFWNNQAGCQTTYCLQSGDSALRCEALADSLHDFLRDKAAMSVCIGDSLRKPLFARLAARQQRLFVSDIIGIENLQVFQRPMYAGNVVATVACSSLPGYLSIRPSAFATPHETNMVLASENKLSFVELPYHNAYGPVKEIPEVDSDLPELQTASRVVSGGRGLKNKEQFTESLYPLAEALHAAIGASRAAVDAEWIGNAHQVGQTGKIIAPDCYFAFGISGAIQHLSGMKDSRCVVAINTDTEAPICEYADYIVHMDAVEAAKSLLRLVTE